MKILYIAPPTERIPPYRYGAVGRVVDYLLQGCFEHGYDIDLIASADSRTRALNTIPSVKHPVKYLDGIRDKLLDVVRTIAPRYDLVHNHESRLATELEEVCCQVPVITTCHLEQQDVWRSLSRQALVALSHDQANRIGSSLVRAIIPPCINVSEFELNQRDDHGYLLVLSKLSHKKGILDAIQIAKNSSRPLVLAGPVLPKNRYFYNQKIAPEIDGRRIIYYGEAVESERRKLLRHASALLFPNRYGEPFGVVLLEALASGVPVVATGNNAAPEVIQHGKTGFLSGSISEATEFIDQVSDIRAADCRLSAESYDYHSISRSYIQLYNHLIEKKEKVSRGTAHSWTVFLIRGYVSFEWRRMVTTGLHKIIGRYFVSRSVESWMMSRAIPEICRIICGNGGTIVIWDKYSEFRRQAETVIQKIVLMDVTLVSSTSHFTRVSGERGGSGEGRAMVPSMPLSQDVPAEQFVRQLVAMRSLR